MLIIESSPQQDVKYQPLPYHGIMSGADALGLSAAGTSYYDDNGESLSVETLHEPKRWGWQTRGARLQHDDRSLGSLFVHHYHQSGPELALRSQRGLRWGRHVGMLIGLIHILSKLKFPVQIFMVYHAKLDPSFQQTWPLLHILNTIDCIIIARLYSY